MDFSNLEDAQIPELVRLLCIEARKRGLHLAQATQAVIITEAEKARLEAEMAQREAEQQRWIEQEKVRKEAQQKIAKQNAHNNWIERKTLIKPIGKLLPDGILSVQPGFCTIRQDQELSQTFVGERPYKVVYYHAGTERYPPGKIRFLNFPKLKKDDMIAIKRVCRKACEKWPNGVQFSIGAAYRYREMSNE